MRNKYYLKPSVQVEPLFCKWYAWPYLLAPHTAVYNIVERHIKIKESFIQNPKIHIQAVKNPAMVGGPFLDLPEDSLEKVKELLEFTKTSCQTLINLHNALKQAHTIVQNKAKGYYVENLYALYYL